MRRQNAAGALLLALAIAGCAVMREPERSVCLRVAVLPDKTTWSPGEEISGRVVFINECLSSAVFPVGVLPDVRIVDTDGHRPQIVEGIGLCLGDDQVLPDGPTRFHRLASGAALTNWFYISTAPSIVGGFVLNEGTYYLRCPATQLSSRVTSRFSEVPILVRKP